MNINCCVRFVSSDPKHFAVLASVFAVLGASYLGTSALCVCMSTFSFRLVWFQGILATLSSHVNGVKSGHEKTGGCGSILCRLFVWMAVIVYLIVLGVFLVHVATHGELCT